MSPAPHSLGLASALSDPALRPRARTAVTLGAAFAILGVALFGLEVPSGLAQGGFFDFLFGNGPDRYVSDFPSYRVKRSHARSWRSRSHTAHHWKYRQARWGKPIKANYAHLRRAAEARATARRAAAVSVATIAAPLAAARAAKPTTVGRRSVCVRACDGYFFPLANVGGASDMASHQATCATICPGAETRLFVMRAGSDKIEDAVAARGGQLYSEFTARLNSAEAKPEASCSCHSTAGNPVESSAFLNDSTLRPGDSVVTPQGVRVFRGGGHYPHRQSDFLALADTRDVPRATRGALAAIEKAMKTPQGRATAANDKRRHKEQRSENTHDVLLPKVKAD